MFLRHCRGSFAETCGDCRFPSDKGQQVVRRLAETTNPRKNCADKCQNPHTLHILPPSEIDLGLFWAVFAGSEGKHLFHRIG